MTDREHSMKGMEAMDKEWHSLLDSIATSIGEATKKLEDLRAELNDIERELNGLPEAADDVTAAHLTDTRNALAQDFLRTWDAIDESSSELVDMARSRGWEIAANVHRFDGSSGSNDEWTPHPWIAKHLLHVVHEVLDAEADLAEIPDVATGNAIANRSRVLAQMRYASAMDHYYAVFCLIPEDLLFTEPGVTPTASQSS